MRGLATLCKKTGLKTSEHIQRALHDYLTKDLVVQEEKTQARLSGGERRRYAVEYPVQRYQCQGRCWQNVTVQPSAISLAWVREESRSFGTGCFFSLQPRLTQGGKMALQDRRIFDGHALAVNLQ